ELVFGHIEASALPIEQCDPRSILVHFLQLLQRSQDQGARSECSGERRGEEGEDGLMHCHINAVELRLRSATSLVPPIQVLQHGVVPVEPLCRREDHRVIGGHALRGQQRKRYAGLELWASVRWEL